MKNLKGRIAELPDGEKISSRFSPFQKTDIDKRQAQYEKAFRAGWQTRSFEETAFDILTDFYSGQFMKRPTFLSPAKEKEVLEAWAHRAS